MKFGYLTLGVALLAALPAYAHEPKASHGGRLADAGPYHVELVAKDTAIEVFLIGENDKPVDPKGFKGVAIFNLGGKAERITLAPSEKNNLSGTAATALPAKPKGRFSSQRRTARRQRRDSTSAARRPRSHARGMTQLPPRHCERSEAIQDLAGENGLLRRFAPLRNRRRDGSQAYDVDGPTKLQSSCQMLFPRRDPLPDRLRYRDRAMGLLVGVDPDDFAGHERLIAALQEDREFEGEA